ncbi:MAG: glycosyltransferase family 4 protein [Verrucomicrobia bacterium]|nr:glycosyltransferase family 4 protein [Verrucomicrobiota bacterium]
MKILYLCPDLGIPVLGRKGASVHVRELCGAFHRAGHRVVLAAQMLNKSPWEKPAVLDVPIVQVRPSPGAGGAVLAFKEFNELLGVDNSLPGELRRILYNKELEGELLRRFENDPPDFIYERASLYATAGVSLARTLDVPLILELNAPLAVEQAAYRATGFGELAAQAERWTLSHADAVVVVSSELAKHARSLGVKPGKLHVIPNGVNPELFYPAGAERGLQAASDTTIRKKSELADTSQGVNRSGLKPALRGAGHGSPVLGFVGGLRPWHGVEILPDLLARLKKRHPGVRLVIAGDGQLRSALEREFARRGLRGNVTITGLLPHEAVPEVIRQFDVALAPYPAHKHDFYFSPLKLFEYMACGVPVVAAKLGQIAEVVRHGTTGLLYPPGNLAALTTNCERLLNDAKLRAKLGSAAAKLVLGRFTWEKNAGRVVALARKLAAVH